VKIRVLLTAVVVMLAGCGAGQDAQTARTAPSIAGVSADAGGIAVRNAVVEFSSAGYPAGAEAPVRFAVVNSNPGPVRLTQLASEGAASATLASATTIGGASAPPDAGTTELTLATNELVTVTVRLTGLTEELNGTSSVPLTLTFDNGAELPLVIPMATPEQPLPREPSVVEGEETEH
jgi:periplasmic copper chaperone A